MKIVNVSKVKPAPLPTSSGYPVGKPPAKPIKVRGTGAAVKGTHASGKMG